MGEITVPYTIKVYLNGEIVEEIEVEQPFSIEIKEIIY
jgi:hypothetical protein